MAEFDQLVQRIMNDWKVPGLAIAIVQADKVYTKVNHLIDSIIASLEHLQPGLSRLGLWLRTISRNQSDG